MISELLQKFRQSTDYTYPMLIRDLIDLAQDLTGILGSAETPEDWTPDLTFGGAKVGMTASTARGKLTRVGKLILFKGEIQLTNKGTSVGAAVIGGLPVNFSATNFATGELAYYAGMAWAAGNSQSLLALAGAGLTIRTSGAAASFGATEANFTNASRLIFSGSGIIP